MNGLIRRSPIRELNDMVAFKPTRDALFSPFQQIFDKFYEDFWDQPLANVKSKSTFPKWDIYVDNDKWIVEVGVSGANPEDINVEILDADKSSGYKKMLKVSGQMSSDTTESTKWVVRELRRSSFERCIYLPVDLEGDPIATMKNGVLKLTWDMPKEKPPDKTSKTIEIKQE